MRIILFFRIIVIAVLMAGLFLIFSACKKDKKENSDEKPIAEFQAIPTSGYAPLTINFIDQSLNTPISWSWDFGDGASSKLKNPSHTYNSPGRYTVKLIVANSYGSYVKTKSDYINVTIKGIAPAAAFAANPTNGNKPLTVNFTDQSTNTPTNWSWNFGDGATSTQKNPTHTYSTEGKYDVTLMATNNYGSDGLIQNDYIIVTQVGATGTVSDIDGNVYQTIEIGTQTWMAENLEVTHYRDGTIIPNVSDKVEWSKLYTGAYVWYNNDITWKDNYGALYNWYTVDNLIGMCPAGWHVPNSAEWMTLYNNSGGHSVAGGNLKSNSTDPDPHPRWDSPNIGATNFYGFAALPGGSRNGSGTFWNIGAHGAWWSLSAYSSQEAWSYSMSFDYAYLGWGYNPKRIGFSVRCVKD